jgi:hypothetical protein
MKPGRDITLFGFAISAVVLSSSCINSNSVSPQAARGKRFFAVTAEAAPFYYYGPRQGRGPDRTLSKDTRVAMIRPSFGYCKVRLVSGEEGYVANDDLHMLSSVALATRSAASVGATAAAQVAPEAADSQLARPSPNPDFEPTPIPFPQDLSNLDPPL